MKSSPARVEVTLKVNTLPKVVREGAAGAKTYVLGNESGLRFEVTLNKKSVKRLIAAAEQWPEWLGVISGRCGEKLGDSLFRLESAGLTSVVDRTPKPETPQGAAAESSAEALEASEPANRPVQAHPQAAAVAPAVSAPSPSPTAPPKAPTAPKPVAVPAYKPLAGAKPVEAAQPAPKRRRLSPQEQRILASHTVTEVMFKRS